MNEEMNAVAKQMAENIFDSHYVKTSVLFTKINVYAKLLGINIPNWNYSRIKNICDIVREFNHYQLMDEKLHTSISQFLDAENSSIVVEFSHKKTKLDKFRYILNNLFLFRLKHNFFILSCNLLDDVCILDFIILDSPELHFSSVEITNMDVREDIINIDRNVSEGFSLFIQTPNDEIALNLPENVLVAIRNLLVEPTD